MTDFQNATGEIDKILAEYEEMTLNIQKTLRDNMKNVFKVFFETYPQVKTVHWTQYAPYFNDGEECIFSVHEPYFTATKYKDLNEPPHAYGEDDDGLIETRSWNSELKKYVNNEIDSNLVRDMKTLSNIIMSNVNERVMEVMFGNHVWVKAHKDGFDVEDYDHD